MATKNSGELAYPGTYTLGKYEFTLVRSASASDATLTAYCTEGEDQGSQSITIDKNTAIEGWRVEANDTTADVYAVISTHYPIVEPFLPSDLIPGSTYNEAVLRIQSGSSDLIKTFWMPNVAVNASLTPVETRFYYPPTAGWGMGYDASQEFTYAGKTVYYGATNVSYDFWNSFGSGSESAWQHLNADMLAWIMFYGMDYDGESQEVLVGRFRIDINDAGGAGSDWEDPIDIYIPDPDNPDWEPDLDPPDPEEMLTLDLDKWYGAPGDSFVATIGGSNGEGISFVVKDDSKHVYIQQTLSGSQSDITVTINTAESWLAEGQGSKGFTVSASTAETGRIASDAFTLEAEEPTEEMLLVEVNPDEGYHEDVLVATVGGHMGQICQYTILNSYGKKVAFGRVSPADEDTAASFDIVLNEAWLVNYTLQEAMTLVVTAEDGRETSCCFRLLVEEPKPDPERILKITITGASSGSGADYTPSANDTVAFYGSGGSGGHGGGGGAGASTVVVYKFATDKADFKEITTVTRSPGVGSAGGKGGTGGDGCILIYY